MVLTSPTVSVLNPLIEIVSHFLSNMGKPILMIISSQIRFSGNRSKYGESVMQNVLLAQTKLNFVPPVGNVTESVMTAIFSCVSISRDLGLLGGFNKR